MAERRLGSVQISGYYFGYRKGYRKMTAVLFSYAKSRISQTPPALLKAQYALSSKLEDISTLLRVGAL